MDLIITFSEKNPDYSQEYANQYNDGEESHNNPKVNFSKSFMLKNIEAVKFNKKGNQTIKAIVNNSEEFSSEIKNIPTLECYRENKIVSQRSVSNTILDKTLKIYKEKENKCYFYIYLKPNSEYSFIASNTFCLSELDMEALTSEINRKIK